MSHFVFIRKNTLIQVWNNLRVSKLLQNLHFGANHPLTLSERYRSVNMQLGCSMQIVQAHIATLTLVNGYTLYFKSSIFSKNSPTRALGHTKI